MCWNSVYYFCLHCLVSVAGCLGYDVLEKMGRSAEHILIVSVAGCLGYDVLVN